MLADNIRVFRSEKQTMPSRVSAGLTKTNSFSGAMDAKTVTITRTASGQVRIKFAGEAVTISDCEMTWPIGVARSIAAILLALSESDGPMKQVRAEI